MCDPFCKLTSNKVTWTWNASYQSLFNKAKLLRKSDMCMKFYDTKLLYLEADTSGVGLGAALLQTQEGTTFQKDMVPDNTILHSIVFASKVLTGAEHRYSNIEREALGILHGLKKFHDYCFAREVHIITYHKPLVTIFRKDVAKLSHSIQHILLKSINIGSKFFTNPGQKYLLQTSYHGTTTKKAKMNLSKTWV